MRKLRKRVPALGPAAGLGADLACMSFATELAEGVLRIAFPKVPDKRGEELPITIKIGERS